MSVTVLPTLGFKGETSDGDGDDDDDGHGDDGADNDELKAEPATNPALGETKPATAKSDFDCDSSSNGSTTRN